MCCCVRCRIYLGIRINEMVVEKSIAERLVSIEVQCAGADDLDAIAAVEAESYAYPWSRNLIQGSLESVHALNFVARGRHEPVIHGFILNLLIADELHILNLAVHPLSRRSGIGNLLMETSLAAAREHKASSAFLEVRRSNIQALTLYIKQGFSVIGVRRGYYSDNREDALVMKKSMGR